MNRRSFLETAGLAGLSSAIGLAQKRRVLKVSLNAYSFNKLLNDSIKGRGQGVTLIQVLEFAAKNKFEGFDPTGYYFPGYPEAAQNSYVDELKQRAADAQADLKQSIASEARDWVHGRAHLELGKLAIKAGNQSGAAADLR